MVKTACVILTVLIVVAIMAVCVMVKFATEITIQEKKRESYVHGGGSVYNFAKSMGVITLNDNTSQIISERFPYVAAITRNSSSTWSFSCFASVILVKWVVTSAHCRKHGATHRVLIYHDFIKNYTHTYPILFWRLHEKFNITRPTPKYDIAVAKLNVDLYSFSMRPAVFDEKPIREVEVSVWKTVSTMDKKMFLTNDFDKLEMSIVHPTRCFESYGVELDETLMCVDLSDYEDCFTHEFGPIFYGDKVVGILAVKPRDCDVKLAIFTNVSYYSNWILRSTHTTYYG